MTIVDSPWPTYLFNQDRQSRHDYLCVFDHEDLERARESCLWHGDWERQTDQVLDVMRAYGLLRDGLRVLDVGCGVGRVASALLGATDATVVGVDRSPHMLRHAKAALDPWIETGRVGVVDGLSGVGTELRFDLVILIEVAQHVPQVVLEPLLAGAASRLEPGGHVFVYGNEFLDVDRRGRYGTTTVKSAVRQVLPVVRSDTWDLEPQMRWSLVAERP